MRRRTRNNTLIISAALGLAAATALGAEHAGSIDRAAFQAELAPLSADARARAANVGRGVVERALTVTHCIALRPVLKLAATRGAPAERS